MRVIRRCLCSVSILVILCGPSHGQQSAPPVQLSLRRAIELALQHSRDLELARLRATAANQTARLDRSQFGPNLFTGSGYEYSSGFPLAPGGGVPTAFELVFNQTIYNALSKGQEHADEIRAKSDNDTLDSVRDAVMVRTANTYLELTSVRHSLELIRKEREDAQKISDLIRERVAAGYELPIEQTRAELSAAKIEQRIAHEEGREDALESQLRDDVGLSGEQRIDVVPEDLPRAAERPVNEIVTDALETSGDVRQAEAEERAKEEILKGTRRNRLPSLSLVGNYSILSNTDNFSTFFKKFQRNNINVGMALSVPIFVSHASAAIAEAQAELDIATADARNARSRVELQVRSQAHAVREMETICDVARLDLKLAQESLAMLQTQYEQGRTTLQELERAHLDENDKWVAFLDADFQRQKAELALLLATGQVSRVLQ